MEKDMYFDPVICPNCGKTTLVVDNEFLRVTGRYGLICESCGCASVFGKDTYHEALRAINDGEWVMVEGESNED